MDFGTDKVNITENDMTTNQEFWFGNGFIEKDKIIKWSPDAYATQNAHMLIVGGSGSGKTRLLKKIIEYLDNKRKQIYIIDFHGDMKVEGDHTFKFTLRNSQYGLNPFEMENDIENGGPNAQANIILSNLKKNFIPNMGAYQKNILRRFLIDCYRYVGILDEDVQTWNKSLPTINTMMELYHKILSVAKLAKGHSIALYLEKLSKLEKKEQEEVESEKKEKIIKKIQKELDSLNSLTRKYNDYLLEGKYKNLFDYNISTYVDSTFYLDPSIAKTFAGLYPYLSDLKTSSVFNDNRPPKRKGIVRYDISGFTNTDKPSEAMFFADTVIQKIFRAVKIRGEYRKLKNRKGKADTFVIIDESKLVLPTGKDKENPYNILNRIVTESRKYGMGLIIVSQRPEHFPDEMLSSIYTKVVLRINENDKKKAISSLGIKKEGLLRHLGNRNVALVGYTGGIFESAQIAYESYKQQKI